MKRSFDIILSFSGLILLIPVFFIISLILFIFSYNPIIFKQNRPGINGMPFEFYKFRTMDQKRNKVGELLPDRDRITKLGKFLRNTSLDELPSFWNVLKGDMSLVGPRPLLVEYLEHYSIEQARRHDVKPGITGWAQVNGRNAISWEEKFTLDLWYVDNQSLLLDFKIILVTIWKVIKRDGIINTNQVNMKKFTGEKNECQK